MATVFTKDSVVFQHKMVQERFEEPNKDLKVLPPNSPDLSPIEILWNVLDEWVWSTSQLTGLTADVLLMADITAHLQSSSEAQSCFLVAQWKLHNIKHMVLMFFFFRIF